MNIMIPSFAETNKTFQEESAKRAQKVLERMNDEIRKSANNGETYAEITVANIYYAKNLRKTLRELGYLSTCEEEGPFYRIRCYLDRPWWHFW